MRKTKNDPTNKRLIKEVCEIVKDLHESIRQQVLNDDEARIEYELFKSQLEQEDEQK